MLTERKEKLGLSVQTQHESYGESFQSALLICSYASSKEIL